MWHAATLRFASFHPSAEGHFPGNPIIPGALLLDEALAAILGAAATPVTVRSAKFLAPLAPGESVNLRWQHQNPTEIGFECRRETDGELVMTGRLVTGVVK